MAVGPAARVRPERGRAAPGLSGRVLAPSEKRVVPVAWPGRAWRPSHSWFFVLPGPGRVWRPGVRQGESRMPARLCDPRGPAGRLAGFGLIGTCPAAVPAPGHPTGRRVPQCRPASARVLPRPTSSGGRRRVHACRVQRVALWRMVLKMTAHGVTRWAPGRCPRVRVGARASESPGFTPH